MVHGIFKYFSNEDKQKIKIAFLQNGFVYLDNFLTDSGLKTLKNIELELSDHYMRKDFLMAQSHNSPRHINVIGGKATNEKTELYEIYRSDELINFLTEVTSEHICECDELIENVIFTTLTEPGDTHGWHKDDFPIALIISIESSDPSNGGNLQYFDSNNELKEIHLKKQDAYIIRSDLFAHRVTPFINKSLRTILNFTYSFTDLVVNPNGSAIQFCD